MLEMMTKTPEALKSFHLPLIVMTGIGLTEKFRGKLENLKNKQDQVPGDNFPCIEPLRFSRLTR